MYTIGEFSKIAHVSARMLRYYESLGLITPIEIGRENGYRYYASAQLSTIFEIQKLQSYGVKLKDISLVLTKSIEERQCYYQNLYQDLINERNNLDMKIQLVYQEIHSMEAISMENPKVIFLNNPSQYVYSIKRTININATEIQQLFHDLYTTLKEKSIKRTGPMQLVYLSNEFSHEHMEVEAQVQVTEDTPSAHCLPAYQCISTVHTGPHETLHQAYEILAKWMSEHPDYHLCGPVIERFLMDDHEKGIFETGVLFPVTNTHS